jgi:hypothetical protein
MDKRSFAGEAIRNDPSGNCLCSEYRGVGNEREKPPSSRVRYLLTNGCPGNAEKE